MDWNIEQERMNLLKLILFTNLDCEIAIGGGFRTYKKVG